MTSINSGAGFEQTLYRETTGETLRWNGSISAMTWAMGNNSGVRRYDYQYDNHNRLTDAHYSHYNVSSQPGREDILTLIPNQGGSNEDYTTYYEYDKNSNLVWVERQGWNGRRYDTLDDIWFDYNGNQRVYASASQTLMEDYYGKFNFVDGTNTDPDYSYNANGALIKDLNKDITNIDYDLLGNPMKVTIYTNNYTYTDNRFIEYVYAADGRRLKTIHSRYIGTPTGGGCVAKDTTSYYGNLILKNGMPQMYRFSGGYYDFLDDGSLNDSHYYIADYLGNNRMVVNASTNETEQQTHYYPYGGIIADLSSGQNEQEFKFGDKKLDRTYGLDLYDFEARQYDAIAPWFTSIDPLAEKYYSISPYAYCAGDPVNCVDPDGRDVFDVSCSGVISVNLGPTIGTHLRFLDTQKREIGKTTLTWTTNEFDQIMTDLSGDKNQCSVVTPCQGVQILKAMCDYQHHTWGSEWLLSVSENGNAFVATSHEYNRVKEDAIKKGYDLIGENFLNIKYRIHLHPGRDTEDKKECAGTCGPSDPDIAGYKNNKKMYDKNGKKMYRAFVLHQGTGKVIEYNENGIIEGKEWDSIEEWYNSMFINK